MNQLIDDFLKPLVLDAIAHRRFVVVFAILILAGMTTVGVFWPSSYRSTVTIFVEERNILGPLMEGTAVQTDPGAQARLAEELIFGRKILGQIAASQGLIDENTDPLTVDMVFENIRGRTAIDLVSENLIEIQYTDTDPKRAYDVTSLFAELFIADSKASKLDESRSAYEFIDRRVEEYEAKLESISSQIEDFRAANPDIGPGAETQVRERIQSLNSDIGALRQQIREAEVKAESIQAQLSGESEKAIAAAETDQIQQRIAALQKQLDTLRLSYHDTYPDIVALKAQIEDLRNLRGEARALSAPSGPEGEDARKTPTYNVVSQQLKQSLYDANTEIATLNARLGSLQKQLDVELDRARRIPMVDSTLGELTRQVEINQNLYNELMRRREYARVSMNVDQENQGLTMSINEPANYPTHASGLRLLHFVLGGILLAFGLPLGALLVKQHMDQRIRLGSRLSRPESGLNLLASIPHLATPKEVRFLRLEMATLAMMMFLALCGAGAVGVLRLKGIV